ncbi:MAG: ABC transporter permease [Bacteroidota bacterium]|nr:ABC transporter permease [Bacteroidota bacterium]
MQSDIISLAYHSVRSNKLRTGITVAIIALGIMALIGIITAIKAMNQKLTESFSTMGANGFTLRYKERNIQFGQGIPAVELYKKGDRKEKKSNLGKPITIHQAEQFISNYHFPAIAGISTFTGRSNTVTFGNKKTNPDVFLFGGDENYLQLNGFEIFVGRNFNRQEVQQAASVCILGYDVAHRLFKNNEAKAVNQVVRVNGIPLRVIGVLASRGSTFGFSRDNIVIISYKTLHRNYTASNSYSIGVKTNDIKQVEEAMGEAEALFRGIRKLTVTEQSNFVLDRSDSIAEKAMNSLRFLTISVMIIGMITLVGAAIGLMNIMLVSVTERTKEVGLIKAIGGKSKAVRQQFLTEAIIISIMGALFGIVLGIGVGNVFSLVLQTGFVVPWVWVLYGICICTIVGLLAGLYPALKAGRLNPIEALRYE